MSEIPPLRVPTHEELDPAGEWDEYAPWEAPAATNGTAETEPKPDLDLDAFLDEDEPDYEWVIPDVLERSDRVILTGPEGGGKSTLQRQMAVQCAAGIHPFTLDPMEPLSVMLLDLENSKRQVRRAMRPLRIAAGDALEPGRARIRVVSAGIDLLSELYVDFLDRRIQANKPDVVFMGPLYKLAGGDPTEERVAATVAKTLDGMRTKYGFALVMEAHSPHPVGNAKRVERPYGASLWLRWPEFGLFLDKDGSLRHWRGARDEREWPTLLKRGGEWPWTPVNDARSVTFARIIDEVRKAGRALTERELVDAIGGSKTTVHRAIEQNRKQWDLVVGEFS